jgi:deoxyadenosine/deoxycytidine kinase
MKNNIFTVCIDGSIGVGKSTMIDILKNKFKDWVFIPEPVEEWINSGILDAFYKDMNRYSYTFQSKVFIDRTKVLMECINPENNQIIRVVERSPYADRYCFAQNCYDSGLMNKMEWNIYTEWFDWLSYTISLRTYIDMFVFLKCDPSTSFERIKSRGRKEEDKISIDYLKKLSKCYNDLYEYIDIPACEAPELEERIENTTSSILTLDARADFKNNDEIQNEYIEQIYMKIQLLMTQ